uniref:Uncharacterized protein n=1 Tax=Heterorhabditis bacteriophora TaxID=37862 RepID=A0A1I7XD41_HETBA
MSGVYLCSPKSLGVEGAESYEEWTSARVSDTFIGAISGGTETKYEVLREMNPLEEIKEKRSEPTERRKVVTTISLWRQILK